MKSVYIFTLRNKQRNKAMTFLEAVSQIKRIKEVNRVADGLWSQECISYQLRYNGKSLSIAKSIDGGWLVVINSECISVARTLKAAKEVGAYYLTK